MAYQTELEALLHEVDFAFGDCRRSLNLKEGIDVAQYRFEVANQLLHFAAREKAGRE